MKDRRSVVDRLGAHPDVLEFERLMYKRFDRMGIPLVASQMVVSPVPRLRAGDLGPLGPYEYGCAVSLVHGTLGPVLTPDQWDLIGHVGRELCVTRGRRLQMVWGMSEWVPVDPDDVPDPAHWEVLGWQAMCRLYPFRRG